jgi:hypothetical protein
MSQGQYKRSRFADEGSGRRCIRCILIRHQSVGQNAVVENDIPIRGIAMSVCVACRGPPRGTPKTRRIFGPGLAIPHPRIPQRRRAASASKTDISVFRSKRGARRDLMKSRHSSSGPVCRMNCGGLLARSVNGGVERESQLETSARQSRLLQRPMELCMKDRRTVPRLDRVWAEQQS